MPSKSRSFCAGSKGGNFSTLKKVPTLTSKLARIAHFKSDHWQHDINKHVKTSNERNTEGTAVLGCLSFLFATSSF